MTEHDAPNGAGAQSPRDDSSGTGAREAAWDDVAAQFSNLGKQLRSRFDRPSGEAQAAGETGSAREGSGGDTVRRWIDTLDDTFTKLGDTVRDPEFRSQAGSSMGQLGQALGATLRDLGDQLQGRFGRDRTESAPGEDMPDVPPPPSTTDVPLAGTTPPPTSDVPASEVPPAPQPATPPPTSTTQVPPSEVPPVEPKSAPTSEVPPPPGEEGTQPAPEERPPAP